MVVYADDVALRAVAGGVVGGIAAFRIAALGAGAVDVEELERAGAGGHFHISESFTEGDIYSVAVVGAILVGGGGPIEGVVGRAAFVDDGSRSEDGVDGGGGGGVGGAGVIDDGLEFFGGGESPILVIGEFEVFGIGKGVVPVESDGGVSLLPHEAGGQVGDGAVGVVDEVVETVGGVAPDITDILGLGFLVTRGTDRSGGIAFDAAVGEVDAEDGGVVIHGGADVLSGGEKLGVDKAFVGGFVAVGEVEIVGVDIGNRGGGGHAGDAGKIDKGI